MKVKVSYCVVRTMELEIPDKLADEYENARAKDDDDAIDFAYEGISEYLLDTIPQIDEEADYKPDIYDWDIV